VAAPSDIEVLEPTVPDPFPHGDHSGGSPAALLSARESGHWVKVAGAITMLGSNFLYLQDESGGVEVRGDTRALHLNETIEVVGYPTLVGRYSPVMTDACCSPAAAREQRGSGSPQRGTDPRGSRRFDAGDRRRQAAGRP